LALWQQKHILSDGKLPFEDLEPVLRALESLDPNNPVRRYYPNARPLVNDTKERAESRKWLELAEGLDNSARILIRQCITNAAASAIDKSKEWVTLAERAGCDDIELPIIRIIVGERDLDDRSSDPQQEQRKLLEGRVSKLRVFIKLATIVSASYERHLRPKRSKPNPKTPGKCGETSPPVRQGVKNYSAPQKTPRKKKSKTRSQINAKTFLMKVTVMSFHAAKL
jgi:hypothetical protein